MRRYDLAMVNQYVIERIAGIQQTLMAVHASGALMSASSKGLERQQFIDSFLANAFPPLYRFGTGDATDSHGHRSGQLDVVIEYPFAPTIPVGDDKPTRLYLAEGIAAVIEVKSDVASQWEEAKRTAEQLAPLQRAFDATMSMGSPPSGKVPLYVVGYKGWTSLETVKGKLGECPDVAGILVIENGIFCSRTCQGSGPVGIWAFIVELFEQIRALLSVSVNPFAYIQ